MNLGNVPEISEIHAASVFRVDTEYGGKCTSETSAALFTSAQRSRPRTETSTYVPFGGMLDLGKI